MLTLILLTLWSGIFVVALILDLKNDQFFRPIFNKMLRPVWTLIITTIIIEPWLIFY